MVPLRLWFGDRWILLVFTGLWAISRSFGEVSWSCLAFLLGLRLQTKHCCPECPSPSGEVLCVRCLLTSSFLLNSSRLPLERGAADRLPGGEAQERVLSAAARVFLFVFLPTLCFTFTGHSGDSVCFLSIFPLMIYMFSFKPQTL